MSTSRWAVAVIMLLAFAAAFAGSAVLRGQTDAEPVAPLPEYEFAGMLQAADAFLASLAPEQRSKALFEFEDAERLNWHFVPRQRRGLPLKEMSAEQQELARGILRAGLSQRGYLTASTIIELELVLREMGGNPLLAIPSCTISASSARRHMRRHGASGPKDTTSRSTSRSSGTR
jgi:hypothetical protein